MKDAVSIAAMLKRKLKGNDHAELEKLTDALLEAAKNKNSTAMKIVVDLVEPTKQEEPEPLPPMTDEEIFERLDQLAARFAARRDLPETRS